MNIDENEIEEIVAGLSAAIFYLEESITLTKSGIYRGSEEFLTERITRISNILNKLKPTK